eukprot:scaffold7065_cov54-Phaeocystis_antarctica.AAC.2
MAPCLLLTTDYTTDYRLPTLTRVRFIDGGGGGTLHKLLRLSGLEVIASRPAAVATTPSEEPAAEPAAEPATEPATEPAAAVEPTAAAEPAAEPAAAAGEEVAAAPFQESGTDSAAAPAAPAGEAAEAAEAAEVAEAAEAAEAGEPPEPTPLRPLWRELSAGAEAAGRRLTTIASWVEIEVQITKQLQARPCYLVITPVIWRCRSPSSCRRAIAPCTCNVMCTCTCTCTCGVRVRWSIPRRSPHRSPRRSPPQESLHGSVVTDFAGHAYELRTVHSMQTEP